MRPSIHPRTIQEVKDKADIVDVISEHIVLKKKGKEFVGICPFHDDNKPSMTVSPTKQFYYCFSCGAGGNSIKFLMEFTRNNFTDVVLSLAKKNDITVIDLDGPQQESYKKQLSKREELYKILRVANKWFRSQLNSSLGEEALSYLLSQRNLSSKNVNDFELGFAPNSWNNLFNYLSKVEKFQLPLILSSGLAVSKDNSDKVYDRFRNRLIVPIFDMQGRVVAFGGRSLDGQEPKYLNSPESDVFEKGKMLFAFDKASSNIRKRDMAIVVEGYFDVITLHDAGVTNVVASLGTSFSQRHALLLKRFTKEVLIIYDGDSAGMRAATRGLNTLVKEGLQVKVALLPNGEDPDSLVRNGGSEAIKTYLDRSLNLIEFQIQRAVEQGAIQKIEVKKSEDNISILEKKKKYL